MPASASARDREGVLVEPVAEALVGDVDERDQLAVAR